MQETVLAWAADKGAEVRRGVSVTSVEGVKIPAATAATNDGPREGLQARVVVGADGRTSMVRRWGGFQQHDPERNIICGVTLENMHVPTDVFLYLWNLDTATVVVI